MNDFKYYDLTTIGFKRVYITNDQHNAIFKYEKPIGKPILNIMKVIVK